MSYYISQLFLKLVLLNNLVCLLQTRKKILYVLFDGLVSINVIALLSVLDCVTFITLDQLTLFIAVSGL